ncbi:MAG: hypothetical protein JWL70_2487 [Acidimicrobiia bacterium]|nr:hypothetical protein [Acidimicrobiia bacterium]
MTLEAIVVDPADATLDGTLTPDPWWRHGDDGRTVSEQQLLRLASHGRAWSEVAGGGSTRLIREMTARILPEQEVAAAALLSADLDEAIVVLGEPLGSAYALGAGSAARLLERLAGAPLSTLDALFAESGLELVCTDPALSAAPPVFDGHRSATAHLHVVDLDHDISQLPGNDLVLRLPPTATVVGSLGEVLTAFAACDASVVVPNQAGSSAVLGLVGALRDGVEAMVDDEHQLFLPESNDCCWLNGRATDTHRGTRPPVVLGPVVPPGGETDLVRLLRYDEAIDQRERCQPVADELLLLPFWTPHFCATVIRAAEAMEAWDSSPDDDVPGSEISLAAISPRLFAHVEDHVAGWIVPQLRQRWPHVQFNGLQDAFVIKYTPEGSNHLPVHHDISQVSAAVRLNEGFDGGVLEFARQSYDNREVPLGSMLTWPSLVTHPHRSTPVTAGVKYSLTIWWNLPESYRRG